MNFRSIEMIIRDESRGFKILGVKCHFGIVIEKQDSLTEAIIQI
jgi:hypothetical protein